MVTYPLKWTVPPSPSLYLLDPVLDPLFPIPVFNERNVIAGVVLEVSASSGQGVALPNNEKDIDFVDCIKLCFQR